MMFYIGKRSDWCYGDSERIKVESVVDGVKFSNGFAISDHHVQE